MMKMKTLFALVLAMHATTVFAMGEDDPIITKVMIDQLEKRYGDSAEDPLVIEGEVSIGRDLNKFVLKFDMEQVNGETHEQNIEALYSRAIDPYWDLQLGVRQDQKEVPKHDWLVVGFAGVAPYWFEMDTALYFDEDGQTQFRVMAEYEWMLTQRWVLSPELVVNFYGKDDAVSGIGAGLSDSQLGLRLRYEVVREFAPYIGVNWSMLYGKTADYAIAVGGEDSDLQYVAGIRAWF